MQVENEFGAFILDGSVAIAWFMPDEAENDLLHRTAVEGAWAPMIWAIEVGNALSHAVRRKKSICPHATAHLIDSAYYPSESTARRWCMLGEARLSSPTVLI